MKKIVLISVFLMLSFVTKASSYELNEEALNVISNEAKEVSFEEFLNLDGDILKSSSLKEGEKTKGGYLIRSFFCGAIALHRYYMGTNQKWMWAMYLCIPVVGGVTNCVDFWGVVFNAVDYKKYENNDKYIVWLKD
jgi:hypothetical protein